jgi:thiamine pyrophosphate-dependent acetolactate synthase large subunit-like protein
MMGTTTTQTPAADSGVQQTDGFHLMVDALKLNGVQTIYGVAGIPVTDLARIAQTSGIRYIGFRREDSAGNAAAAAGFLTKRPGICLTVSAPGFLNGLPALAAATVNCFPMIQIAGSSERHLVDLHRGEYPAPRQLPAPEAVDHAIGLLAGAERPLIVLGKGAAYAQADERIRAFVESTGIPFLPMSMAKGLLPDDHPQSVAAARSLALGQADVVMLVGARLNWLLGHGEAPEWSPSATFIQADIDATELDSNQPIAAPLVGDIGSVVAALRLATPTPACTWPSAS